MYAEELREQKKKELEAAETRQQLLRDLQEVCDILVDCDGDYVQVIVFSDM